MTGFEIKDSGKRTTYSTGMQRDLEDDKARFDLLYPTAIPYEHQYLTRIAVHLARGALKYGERNWERGFDAQALARARSSALRHMIQWFTGERDEDHAAAVFFNIMQAEYLMYLQETSSSVATQGGTTDQCTAVQGNGIRCVLVAGHPPFDVSFGPNPGQRLRFKHNFSDIGPYAPETEG